MSIWLCNIYVNRVIPWASNCPIAFIHKSSGNSAGHVEGYVHHLQWNREHQDSKETFWACFRRGLYCFTSLCTVRKSHQQAFSRKQAILHCLPIFFLCATCYFHVNHYWVGATSYPASFRRCSVLLLHQRSRAPLQTKLGDSPFRAGFRHGFRWFWWKPCDQQKPRGIKT